MNCHFWFTILLFTQASFRTQDVSLARAVHDAFVANLSSFEFGRVTFQYVKGEAADAASARAALFDPKYVLIGTYSFHGPDARLDHVFPEEEMRRTTKFIGDDTITQSLASFRVATSGKVSVSESLSLRAANAPGFVSAVKMMSGPKHFLDYFQFPISLGQIDGTRVDNLGLRLREALKGNPDYRIEEFDSHAEFEGRPVARISISNPLGREDYWVDLERGAVPLKMAVHYKNKETLRLVQEVYNDDLRRVPDRGWLPFHQAWRYTSNEAGHYVISEADFKQPPPRRALGLDFPEPIGLRNETTRVSYSPRKFWDLAELPSLGSPGVTKSGPTATIPMDQVPTHPREREAPRRYDLLFLGLAALASLIAWVAWSRRVGHG